MDGTYTFSVRATDTAGNVDATPATRSFTVDTVAPQTTIDSGPTGPTGGNAPSFGFSASETSTFECKLDGPGATVGTFVGCTTPRAFTGLADGTYTFSVRATDTAGNLDATPATRSFTVDTAAPDTTIDTGPTGTITVNSATFTFSSSEVDIPVRLTQPFATCTSPFATGTLPDGTYTFNVRATDAAGNVDPTPATRTFTIDTVRRTR